MSMITAMNSATGTIDTESSGHFQPPIDWSPIGFHQP